MSCLIAFHYRSYGTFFLQQNRLHNIYRGFTHYKYYRAQIYRGEQLNIVLLFLFSGGKMIKELQSSRYIVISFLVREMRIDIVEAISRMAELEKSGLVRLKSSGDLILKELGGAL